MTVQTELADIDRKFLDIAIAEAQAGLAVGGIPIGSSLRREDELVGKGHNQRVQKGDAMTHAEIDCMRNAGRQKTYKDTTLYSTLAPCYLCSGAAVQFGVPRIVVGENETFPGALDFLRSHGIEVIVVNDETCIAMMNKFIEDKPELWNEDIGED